jgi:hypothetical protein
LSLGNDGQAAIDDPGPIVFGGGGGGGGGAGAGVTVVGAAVGGGAGVVVVVASSVVEVDVLVDVVTVFDVASLRPASTCVVGVAVAPESHAAAINSIVSANAQIRLRM